MDLNNMSPHPYLSLKTTFGPCKLMYFAIVSDISIIHVGNSYFNIVINVIVV